VRLLGHILLAALVLAALQGILAVLTIAVVLALVVGIIWRPAATLSLLMVFVLLAALDARPWATTAAIGGLAGALLIASYTRCSRRAKKSVPAAALPPPSRPDDGA
jgi:hypothetical protein